MKLASIRTLGRKTNRPSAARRRLTTKHKPVLEQLEDRVALSGLTAIDLNYTNQQPNPLIVLAPGVIAPAYVQPQGNGLMATFNAPGSSGPFHGQLSSLPTGWFQYTPNQGYSGPDQFSYEAFNSLGQTSNLATVFINVLPPATVLPSTPFFNSLIAQEHRPRPVRLLSSQDRHADWDGSRGHSGNAHRHRSPEQKVQCDHRPAHFTP